MCPDVERFDLANQSKKIVYTDQNGYGSNYFYVNMESGKTYTFTFDNSDQNRTVACTVSGSTSPSEFKKLYLIGGFFGDWKDDTTRPFATTDGKTYKYVFDADYTNTFSKESDDYYFRVKTESDEFHPENNDALVGTTFTSALSGSSNNAWKLAMTKGKSYTLIFDYAKKQIKYTEGGSSVVTKEIKLFNAETEVTGSNGKYTLNLSGDTSQDATITLTIDGAKYGLDTAQTISKAGTTLDIAFTTEGKNALTLKAGLIYYLSVTKDGKMKVVAKEKGIADGNYYLVGNFFTEDGESINYDKKYFRFIDNGDGTLSFDIPTTLTVKAQVLASDGTRYGPTKNGNIGIDNPTADDKTVRGKLVEGSNCFTFTDRKLTGDGIYKVTIAVDETGIPTKWTVDFDKTQRMAYFMVDPKEDADAVAHPCYTTKKDNGTSDNKFFGNVYLEAKQHCFVVGNIQVYHDDDNTHILKTTEKLYFQGNGGFDITTNSGDTSDGWKYTNVFPNKNEGFYFPVAQSLYLEYNPSAGNQTYEQQNSSTCHGIAGEVKPANGETPITSIQIVGNGVVDSWDLNAAKNMTYNKTLDCWEYSFRTEKAENADNKFRFLANGNWAMNWGEESTKPEDQARTPYKNKTEQGHEASETDPNNLGRTTNGTEENRDGGETYGDMIFNRPAGQWTIRFYIRSVSTDGGNNYEKAYGYTIIGSESNDIYLTYRTGKFIRTYSNSKPMNPDNNNVKIYEVYKYEKPAKVDNIYTQGKVYLRRLNYVPAKVGVVLIGEAPDDGKTYTDGQKLAFSLLERTEESVEPGGDYRDVWTKATEYKNANDKWNNYLVPTVTAVNDLGNAQVDESGKVVYRYFGLGNYYRTNYHTSLGNADTQSDYIGFFRLTANGKSGANKAYLSIPANAEVGNAVGATYGYIDYNGQLLGNKYDDSTIPASLAKMALVFDDFVEGNETTGIKELETEVLYDNKYYNLQGVEVAYPVKGIYIHNGKKVIVK
ncbi:hypothetical protein [Segatella hominis]|uniref:hypothetical protein n=1 Tax=Segatella hominis TaxID=2518605 RepID=UPI0021C7FA8F|nr:hypothetical protein [Segatella hominis]